MIKTLLQTILIFIPFLVSPTNSQDENFKNWRDCSSQIFCNRYRQLSKYIVREKHGDSPFKYDLDPNSVNIVNNQLEGKLSLRGRSQFIAKNLGIKLRLFNHGILHVQLTDDYEGELSGKLSGYEDPKIANQFTDQNRQLKEQIQPQERFKISDFDGVQWDQLEDPQDYEVARDYRKFIISSKDKSDKISYEIKTKPFRIRVIVNGQRTMEVNSNDLLYFENRSTEIKIRDNEDIKHSDPILQPFINTLDQYTQDQQFSLKKQLEGPDFDFKESIGLSFTMNSQYLFGLPERADNLLLKQTEDEQPYRLYNLDIADHEPYNKRNLYGSIPYMTSHTDQFDTSIVWMNAAETYVDIFNGNGDSNLGNSDFEERLVTFQSESGMMEFFLFSNSIQSGGPKYTSYKLSLITGFAPLPPYFSLGFHYSKWQKINTYQMIDTIQKFNEHEMPVDVLWMDIDFGNIQELIDVVEKEDKRLTVITDPHIKVDNDYFVYKEGMEKLVGIDHDDYDINGVFIRNKDMQAFEGECWPGNSVWVDFLNDKASDFWKSLYSFDKFIHTNKLFNYWIDMNEPSVFNAHEMTMPKDNIHIDQNNRFIQHKDIHNAYGLLMAKSTYQGSIERIEDQNQRPFMLSRSVFFGSQKYGAKWTGDNQASQEFMKLSVQMCLQLSISGVPFCGADIGGFFGEQSQEGYLRWFQNALFQPFFRAHSHIETVNREPWDQGEFTPMIKEALTLRQSFLPYIYYTFYESTTLGHPLMRPMWMEYPSDPYTFGLDTQYMFGNSILVGMTKTYENICEVYLPQSHDWYDGSTQLKVDKTLELTSIPRRINEYCIFMKAGSIIPRKYQIETSAIKSLKNAYTLDIYPSFDNGTASGFIYSDDGDSFNHKTSKEFNLVEFKLHSDYSLEIVHHNLGYKNSKHPLIIDYIKIRNIKEKPKQIMVKNDDGFEIIYNQDIQYNQKLQILVIKDIKINVLSNDAGIVLMVFMDHSDRPQSQN
eukprot:403361316